MIRVTMELLPGGFDMDDDNEILGVMFLSNNVGTTINSGGKRGTYLVDLFKKRNAANAFFASRLGRSHLFKPWKKLRVQDFPRESLHPWNLVLRALTTAANQNGGKI